VQNATEARAAVSNTRYPPAGVRGVAGTTRATRFGRVKDYAKRAHEEICVLVQLETKPALEEIERVAAIDGVDGIFIGPADLHASMGYTGETANPAVMPLIEDSIRRIRKAGKSPGYLSPVEADAKRMRADVGLLARGAENLLAKFKS
jgi:4-hydroxy-2-oxoheptanedioate aldolase